MDKITQYLESVPFPLLVMAPLTVALLFILTPSRHRLSVFLAMAVALLTVGQYVDLGPIRAGARLAAPVMLCLVILAAMLDPGPKRSLHPVAWLYPGMAILGFLFILTVSDLAFAFVLRAQWLLLTAAAVALSRCIVDEASFRRILWAITVGLCVALIVPMLALLKDPGAAFRAGVGRFEPWGASSNQIGIYFGMTAPLALYFGITSPRIFVRWALFGCAAIALSMTILTASRSSLIVGVFGSIPIALRMTRRPLLFVATGTLFVIAASWFLAFMDTSKLNRIQSLETGRAQMAVEYLGVVAERPLFGMLETTGASVLSDDTIGKHPHNAYLETLYLGGVVYAAPMFFLVGYSMLGAWRIWRARRAVAFDPLLTMELVVLMFLVYAHGFVNGAIYYPTYAWALFHVILSVNVITLARDLRWAHAAYAIPGYSKPEFDDSLASAGHAAG